MFLCITAKINITVLILVACIFNLHSSSMIVTNADSVGFPNGVKSRERWRRLREGGRRRERKMGSKWGIIVRVQHI